ncbi:hypothetical protein LINPERPRIM_LOCUS29357 [Linum perenne]
MTVYFEGIELDPGDIVENGFPEVQTDRTKWTNEKKKASRLLPLKMQSSS